MAKQTLVPINGIPRARSPYDEVHTVVSDASGPVTITLPNSGEYTDTELLVELNGQLLRSTIDYNYLGSIPRTQISILRDLTAGWTVRFYKVHNP